MLKPKPRHKASPRKRNGKGFTVLELLVAVVILGVLVTIAIMFLLEFKEKGHVAAVASDLTSAYDASVLYFSDCPNGSVTVDTLFAYGYRQSKDVDLSVVDGTAENLNLTAIHPGVRGVYQVDRDGYVSKQ